MENRPTFCIVCDDVRMEVGNKPSFMGVYISELAVHTPFPVILPKLAFIVYIISPIDDLPRNVTVRVNGPPDGQEIGKIQLPPIPAITQFEDGTKYAVQFPFAMVNVPLGGEGFLEIFVDTEQETSRALKLNVRSYAKQPSS